MRKSGGAAPITRLRAAWAARIDPVPGEASGRIGLAALAAALFAFFSLRYETFLSSDNLINLSVNNVGILIAAMGSMALLVSGNVDISIGSMYGLISVLVAKVLVHTGSTALAVGTGIVLGVALGGFNGVLVRKLPISPLIVTLATLGVYRGLAFLVTDGGSIGSFPDGFLEVGRGGIGPVTYPMMAGVVIFVAMTVWMTRSRTGLRVYAIGGDARPAELNGVPVGRITVLLFTLNGALIGLLSVFTVSRLGLANPTFGTQFEFDVLTAAMLGGVAFAGGGGRPIGILFGVLLLSVINAGLIFEGLKDYWSQIIKGTLLLVALGSDQIALHLRERRNRTAPVAEVSPPTPVSAAQVESPITQDVPASDGPVLKATGMTKRYGGVTAVNDVDITVSGGEIVCVLGDNGAGKSSLIKMLSGAVEPDAGTIEVDGQPVEFRHPVDAQDAGISTVYQDLALCPNLSVAHNFVLGNEPVRWRWGVMRLRDDAAAADRATRYLAGLGIRLKSSQTIVRLLSGGQRQSLAIARAVRESARVVILDEPTASLGVTQTESVLKLVRAVAARGAAVILISHDVQTVMALADRIVVLRLGRVVNDGPVDDLSRLELLELMAGLTDTHSAATESEAVGTS